MITSLSDVVIIGAGPAGAATAIFLARLGYGVTLLDRAAFPRPKPCGEYLTPGAVLLLSDALGLLPQLLQQGATPLTQETVVPHDGRAFGGATEALACPRIVTDNVLRNAAQLSGVTVIENFSVRRILFDGGRVSGVAGTGPNGEAAYHARIVVGADGAHSLLARALRVVQPIPRLQRLALVGHFTESPSLQRGGREDLAPTHESGAMLVGAGEPRPSSPAPPLLGAGGASLSGDAAVTMHLPSDRSDACCGVGAPCGPDHSRNVNIVVPVSEAPNMAGRREDYFQARLKSSFPNVWEQFGASTLTGSLQSVGCFGHWTTRATHDGALLVGDAATFIHPFTGEGVFFALRGAQLAAETIDLALKAGDVSRHRLQSYDSARRRELLPRYRLCDWVQRVVHSPTLLALASKRLRRSSSLTEILLSTLGDVAPPRELLSFQTLRLALGAH